MKCFLLTSLLAFLPLSAHAEYSRMVDYSKMPGVGGSIEPTQGENKVIRLVSERVVLTAGAKDYSTRADFVLSNTTDQTQSVPVNFPEGNYGNWDSYMPPPKTGFLGFKAFVNGQPFVAKRVLCKEPDESGFNAYWQKTLSFAPHQKLSVRLEYAAPYGESTHWGMSRVLSYWFKGQGWNGTVDESTLEVHVTRPGLWRIVANDDTHNSLPFEVKSLSGKATFRRSWKNRQAQNGVRIGLERVIPLWREGTEGSNVGTDESKEKRVKAALAAQVVRVGLMTSEPEESAAIYSTAAFTLNGVFYISADHLSNLLCEWEAEQTPRVGSRMGFLGFSGFDWRVGKTHIRGQKGENIVMVNSNTIALGAPIIRDGFWLFIPISQLARSMGWKLTMQGERLFTLERGNWKA